MRLFLFVESLPRMPASAHTQHGEAGTEAPASQSIFPASLLLPRDWAQGDHRQL